MTDAPPLGLWIDCPPGRVLRGGYLRSVRGLGIRTIAIMVESSRPSWDHSWSLEQVAQVCELARELDLEVILTVWPSPRRSYLDAMASWLIRAADLGIAGVEVDLEGQWQIDDLDWSITSIEVAAAILLERLRTLSLPHDLRLEVTTHSAHRESSSLALVSPYADRLVAQAYSIRRRPGGQLVEWDDRRLGPGHHQHWAAADARTVPGVAEGRPQLSLGLALWSQVWPGHEASEALSLAYQAALEDRPVEIRLWSSKHLLGAQAKEYGRRWLEGLLTERPTQP